MRSPSASPCCSIVHGFSYPPGVSQSRVGRRQKASERVQLRGDGPQEGKDLGHRGATTEIAVPAEGGTYPHFCPPSRPSSAGPSLYTTTREATQATSPAQDGRDLLQVPTA